VGAGGASRGRVAVYHRYNDMRRDDVNDLHNLVPVFVSLQEWLPAPPGDG